MSDLEPKKAPFKILVCAHCQGNGRLKRKTCPQCKGLGVAAWTGKDLLYWGKKINNLQIAQEQLGQTVKNIITLSLFLFGAIGFVMLGLVVIAFVQAQLPFYAILEIKNWQLLVFWVSLLTDCYLFYHLQREIENTRYIPKRKFKDSLENNLAISWQEIKQLPKNHKINVTNYFTGQATQAIVKAWQTAGKYEDEKTNPIHLFISLLSLEQTHVIFSRLGVAFPTLKAKVGRVLSLQPSKTDSPLILSEKLKEIIFQSYILAYQTKQKKVEITELLEALVSQENEVKELLYDLKITVDKIQNVIAWLRMKKQLRSNWKNFRKQAALKPSTTMNRSMTAIATPILDSFSQDMTILAQGGYLLPCVGRQKEFDKLFNILSGGPRRSVLLTGFPGVGKNTIIEGLAQKMVEEEVPDFLQDKRLVSLSIAKLISGATPVLAQERLMLIINEIRRSGNIILYIGDIHNMIGITAGRQGSIDLADVLSQALANNTILCLAATTPGDYHRYIEAKSSLDNVFEQLEVQEVSGNEAILVLESKIGIIESHNEVFFSYDAIEKTVELSDRYLHDRYLPEKAIGILQEVATKVKEKKGKGGIVAAEDIAMVISSKTNIPLTEITKEESQKLLNLEEKIHQRMVDQQEAVLMVAASLRRARAEMRDKSRPIVNLLFLGPTGVGKTELAKTVAEVYFGAEENMIRLDMSEYQEKSSINRLIGAPPGYPGADEGGFLAQAVKKNPFSLILLDEIEKAHPDILNVFLQVMDDGRLTDTLGKTIDFTNTIIIATSNAGTKFIQDMVKQNQPLETIKQQLIDNHLNQYFRPEFLNRFDGIIVFKPLSMPDVEAIAKLMLKKVKKNLEEKGIKLKATNQAITELAQMGYDPEFGARPLRRVIQEKIQDQLANYLISGQITRRDIITIAGADKILIQKAKEI